MLHLADAGEQLGAGPRCAPRPLHFLPGPFSWQQRVPGHQGLVVGLWGPPPHCRRSCPCCSLGTPCPGADGRHHAGCRAWSNLVGPHFFLPGHAGLLVQKGTEGMDGRKQPKSTHFSSIPMVLGEPILFIIYPAVTQEYIPEG